MSIQVRGCRRAGWLALCGMLALLPAARPGPAPTPAPEDADADAAGRTIVVGMSAAFRGPSRGLGIELYRGAAACFAEVNRQGGVHGRRVVLQAYDDGYNPAPAVANTRRLVHRDNAFLLFGYVGTPTTTRVLPLLKHFEEHSVCLFCPFTGAEPQREGPYRSFVFNLRASYRDETRGLVDHLVRVGRRRLAVFYQIDAYGRSGWDGVRRALAGHKLKMVAEATYRRGSGFETSMQRQVELLRGGDPDAVVCVGSYEACAAFIRDARDAGWEVPIANLSFVGSENLLGLLHAHGQEGGRDYTAGLLNTQVAPSYARTNLPGVRLYRTLMDRHAQDALPAGLADADYEPLRYSFTSLEGFLDARLVVEVLRKLGPNPRRGDVRRAAESLRGVDLGLGWKVSFSPDCHQARSEVYYTVVRGGRFVPLTDWDRWKK
jgi:ABC-type branched-subunit amino acid transport system substrate-binding protein